MIILQVSMQSMNKAQVANFERRFGRFFSKDEAAIEYPVTCDSHAYDVFEDEFETGTINEGRVYGAWVVDLPFEPEEFTPFSEETSGVVLSEWTSRATGWDHFPATD